MTAKKPKYPNTKKSKTEYKNLKQKKLLSKVPQNFNLVGPVLRSKLGKWKPSYSPVLMCSKKKKKPGRAIKLL